MDKKEFIEGVADIRFFEDLVYGKSVAVVGNSPTIKEEENGAAIDNCDVVIRFNRFVLDGWQKYTGEKTTIIGCPLGYSPAVPDTKTIEKTAPEMFLAVCPKINKEANANESRLVGMGIPVAFFPIDYFVALAKELGCRPTTGFATLNYLIDECQPKSVFMTGFSFGKIRQSHYFKEGSSFNYTVHDPVKELHMFARGHYKNVTYDTWIHNKLHRGNPSFEYAQLRERKGADYSAPHRWVYEEICKNVAGKAVLEIGAGIGYGSRRMMEVGATVTAVEPDMDSYIHVRKTLPHLQAHNLPFQEFRADRLFDVATCVEVMEHLPAIEVHPFLLQVRQVCKELYLSSPDRKINDHGVRTPNEWRIALKAAGFVVMSIKKNKWATLIHCM